MEHIENSAVNSYIAKLRTVPNDKRFRIEVLEVTRTQNGTTDTWTVTSQSSLQSHEWRWTEQTNSVSVCSSEADAIARFDELLAEMRKREADGYKVQLTSTARPKGITDPLDQLYIKCNLKQRLLENKVLGQCYYSNRIEFSRCDGTRLTADDMIALRNLDRGQLNKVQGNAGDLTAEYYYEVDSSG